MTDEETAELKELLVLSKKQHLSAKLLKRLLDLNFKAAKERIAEKNKQVMKDYRIK